MTPVHRIVAGQLISALNSINIPSTGAVQLLPEQNHTESVIVVINRCYVRALIVTESVVRPGIVN